MIYDWNRESMNGEVLCIDPTVWVTSEVHVMHDQRPLPVAICMDGTWSRDFAIRSLEQHGLKYRIAYPMQQLGTTRAISRLPTPWAPSVWPYGLETFTDTPRQTGKEIKSHPTVSSGWPRPYASPHNVQSRT